MGFQSFDSPAVSRDAIAERVARLRSRLDAYGVDGIVVPHEDAYQSEYLPASEERLAWLTGFTGSAGRAIVLADAALFVTDGRYTLQAEQQVPGDIFTIASDEKTAKAWMAEHLAGRTLGVDPRLHSRADLKRLQERAQDLTLVRLDANPVDAIWTDRPAPPLGRVHAHPEELAGQPVADKIAAVREAMEGDAVLIAASDAVSWLLNWRGSDVAHTPLVLSRALVPRDGPATVFVDPGKVPDALAAALEGLVRLEPADGFLARLAVLAEGRRVQADPQRTPDAALTAIETTGTLVEAPDPAVRLKARKTAAEIEGMRAAHRRDGVAVTRFLAWFDANAVGASEIDLVQRLEAIRREAGAIEIAFDTIAGAGPHGAIVHYRVDRDTNRVIAPGEPVLVDSGGQYRDGTTDITRTLCAGTPSDAFRIAFTRVLKAHIALAAQTFPEDTTGVQLDAITRAGLWRAGLDFAHGTGHGVGAALAVHEGPVGISRRGREALAPGMILSNEPGLYRPGAWGIRTENLVLVREAQVPPGGETAMLSFETLTLAPIDTRLLAPRLMTAEEAGWLDSYHARVRGALSGHLDRAERAWLEERTRPIASD
jgi:Xaa-Pro aminopeptidase